MNVQTVMSRYADYMRQIKYRMAVIAKCIGAHASGHAVTGYRETDIELCYLQLRQCLELVMFSTVIAHDAFGVKLNRQLRDKAYNASQILRQIRHLNGKFYPLPVKDSGSPDGIRKVDKIEEGYLTETEFCRLYDKVCGRFLHADRKDVYSKGMDQYFIDVKTYHRKLIRLLNHHWIHVTDEIALAVLMQTQSDGDVQVVQMQGMGKQS